MKISCPVHGEVEYICLNLFNKLPFCGFCNAEMMEKLGFGKSVEISCPTFNIEEIKNRRFNINSECVQYIVVRKDLVETMGTGKTSAQVAHASLGAILDDGKLIEDDATKKWLGGRFTKLVVYVKSKEALLNLSKKLDEENIRNVKINDACFTKLIPENEDGTTLTCIGVIPLERNNVPKCLKKLQLLD